MSTAVLDPCAGELVTDPLWGSPADPGAETFEGASPRAASLDRWITALLRDLDLGGAAPCPACGDPSGLRAVGDGARAACSNCGSTLA